MAWNTDVLLLPVCHLILILHHRPNSQKHILGWNIRLTLTDVRLDSLNSSWIDLLHFLKVMPSFLKSTLQNTFSFLTIIPIVLIYQVPSHPFRCMQLRNLFGMLKWLLPVKFNSNLSSVYLSLAPGKLASEQQLWRKSAPTVVSSLSET